MPYQLKGNCVIKSSGEVVKTRKVAIKHLVALRLNVKEAMSAIDFTPPEGVQKAALRGLALRRKYKRGGLDNKQASAQGIGSGVQRASNLASGKSVSPQTIKRMVSFFARHEQNKDSRTDSGEPGAGMIAWLLWGGDAGRAWAEKVSRQMDNAAEAVLEHYPDKHNQASHGNRFGSADDIKRNVKRLGKDKEALKRMAQRARKNKDALTGKKKQPPELFNVVVKKAGGDSEKAAAMVLVGKVVQSAHPETVKHAIAMLKNNPGLLSKDDAKKILSGEIVSPTPLFDEIADLSKKDKAMQPDWNSVSNRPWAMTKQQWDSELEKATPNTAQSNFTKASASQAVARSSQLRQLINGTQVRQLVSDKYGTDIDERKVTHRDIVQRALKAGAPVPKEVLIDYPDLKG